MHFTIDGYNLLFFLFDIDGDLQKKREDLLFFLKKALFLNKNSATVVFDSSLNKESRPDFTNETIKIIYTSVDQTADEYMIDYLTFCKRASRETIVSSDKNLTRICRQLGAHTQSCSAFINEICKKKTLKERSTNKEKPTMESQNNIERLLEIFQKKLSS